MADPDLHDPDRAISDLLEKMDRRRHLVFLLGAGSACAGGLPDLSGLTDLVQQALVGDDQSEIERLRVGKTLEELLTYLRVLSAALADGDESINGIGADRAQDLDRKICTAIADCILSAEVDIQHHRRFGLWLASSQFDRPVELFTTNYDLLLELGLESAGVPYFDGFLGYHKGKFRTDLVDEEMAPDRLRLPAGWARLWKLHGSVSWIEQTSSSGRRAILRTGQPTGELDPELVLAIYPSMEKYEESRRLPFLALADRLRRSLAVPDSLIIICGYSFGDDHINELIFEAAELNPRSEVVILCHDSIPQAVSDLALEFPNLSVMARKEGVLHAVRTNWAQPSDEAAPYWNTGRGMSVGDFAVLAGLLYKQVAQRLPLPEPAEDGVAL